LKIIFSRFAERASAAPNKFFHLQSGTGGTRRARGATKQEASAPPIERYGVKR